MSALVKIIKNPFDTSIEENVIKVKAKTCIKDIQGLDQNNIVAYVNGEHVNNDYVLKNGDVCVIRQYPSAVTASAIITGLAIATATLVVGETISYGVSGRSLGQNIKKGLQNWLLPKTDGATNQDREKVETLPSVSGSKNQSAFGKVVPLILGKTMFTPYTECKTAYNTISGEDGCNQMYHCLYIIGQKDLQIEDVSMGLEVLANNSNHETNDFLDITSEKFPYETIDPVTQQVVPEKSYYTQLELQCGENEVSIFNQKVIQENQSTEIMNVSGTNEPFYAYSSRYAQKVELEFTFSGLIGYNSDGTKKDATTEITVEYSYDGGETWHWGGDPNGNCKFDFSQATISHSYDPTTHKITFSGQLSKTLRYVLTHTPSYDDMEDCLAQTITYRIKRANAQSEDANVIDKIYLTAVRTWCYDATESKKAGEFVEQAPMIEKVRNKTTRLGFSIKVDSNVQRDFEKINVIATSKARIYETGEGWTKELYPTRNPVALTLYAMTGDFRENYAYPVIVPEEGDYIECDQIDLEDFGEKYDICEQIKFTEAEEQYQKRYYCDGVVLNPTKTVDLVNSILKCCRSYIVTKGKKYGIFMDKAQDYPLLVLNNNNLLSLTYSKNFDEIPDGHRVKHISSINFYQQNTFDVYPIGTTVTGDEKLVNVEYPFILDQYHAQAMSLYEQACLKLRSETIQAKVTGEGGLAEIGSLIPVQSDVVLVGIGDGAEITELITSGNTITGIKTDGKFAVTDITKEYGVVINVVGNVDNFGVEKLLKRKLASFSVVGEYSTLMFDQPIPTSDTYKPEEGCIVSFGLYQNEVLDMLCVGKNENEDNTYDLTLVPYDENIYLADEGAIPDFDPKTTPPQESGLPINFGDRTVPVTKDVLYEAIKEYGENEYVCVLTMSAVGSAVSGTVYKDGVATTENLYYVDYYGTSGNQPSTAGAEGAVTSGVISIPATVANADKHKVMIYADNTKAELLCTAFVSFGATGTGSDSTSYWLIEDVASIKKDKNGTFTPQVINLSAKYQTGTGAPSAYSGRFKVEYATVQNPSSNQWTSIYTSSSNESTKQVNISSYTTAKVFRCSLYLAGGTSNLLDQDVISVVEDGQDGKNAVTMTSATTPSGTYEGQVGVWQGQIYLWTNNAWVCQETNVPTDAVLHYSFDEVPDYPDGSADVRLLDNNTYQIQSTNFKFNTSTGATITNNNGNVGVQLERTSSQVYVVVDNAYINQKILKLKIKVSSITGSMQVHSGEYNNIKTITDIGEYTISVYHNPTTTNKNFYIFQVGNNTSSTFTIEQIYIGDGSYSTPIIDNANGQWNGTIKGVLSIQGVSGKAGGYTSANNYIEFGKVPLTLQRTITFWLKINNYAEGKRLYTFGNADYTYLSTNTIRFRTWLENETKTVNADLNVRNNDVIGKWVHIAIISDFTETSGTKKLYLNGSLLTQETKNYDYRSITQATTSYLFNDRTKASGLDCNVDDFLIFNRALSEQEVLALYLNKANTPKFFTLTDYQLNGIDDDGIISPTEKEMLYQKWIDIYKVLNGTTITKNSTGQSGEYQKMLLRATTAGVSLDIAQGKDYVDATEALRAGLWTTANLANMSVQTKTSAGAIDNLFNTYRTAYEALSTAIDVQNKATASALSISQSNSYHQIPTDAGGSALSYVGTDDIIYLLEGESKLDCVSASTTLTAGKWKITNIAYTSCTGGATYTISDKGAVIGVLTGISADSAKRTFTIQFIGNNASTTETIQIVQSFAKAKAGADGSSYKLIASAYCVKSNTTVEFNAQKITGNSVDTFTGYLYKNTGSSWSKKGQFINGSAYASISESVSGDTDYRLCKTDSESDYVDELSVKIFRDGVDGQDGHSPTVTSTTVQYKETQTNVQPTSGWGNMPSTLTAGYYLWSKTTITYDDEATAISYSSTRNGGNGTNGTSVTITSKEVKYQAGTSGTTAPTGTWSATIPSVTQGQYLWTRTIVNYSDGQSTTAYSVSREANDGVSPYSVYCSEPSIGLACTTGKVTTASKTITIKFNAFKGETRKGCTIAVPNLPSGVSITSNTPASDNADGTLVLTVASNANLGGTSETYDTVIVPMNVTANNVVYTFNLTLVKDVKGATGSQGTRAIRYQGMFKNWLSGKTYSVGDVVVYETNNKKYTCKATHTSSSSITPTNTTYWTDNGTFAIVGDWYMRTTDGIVRELTAPTPSWSNITWTNTATLPDYRLLECLEDMFVLSETITNNITINNIIDRYQTCFLAGEGFIGKLSTKTINFKNSVSSMDGENLQVGDRMIYMGKNPLEENDSEFRFGISRCRRISGNYADWTRDLFTDFASTGVFGLHTSGIITATDGIYSNIGAEMQKESPIETSFTSSCSSDGVYNFYVVPNGTKYALKYSRDFVNWTTIDINYNPTTYGNVLTVEYLNGYYVFLTDNHSQPSIFYSTSLTGTFSRDYFSVLGGFQPKKIIYSKYSKRYYVALSTSYQSLIVYATDITVLKDCENKIISNGYCTYLCISVSNGTPYVVLVNGEGQTQGGVYRMADIGGTTFTLLNNSLLETIYTQYGQYPLIEEIASNDEGMVYAGGGINYGGELQPFLMKIDITSVDSANNEYYYKQACKFENIGRIYSIASIGNSFIMGTSYGEIVHIDVHGEFKSYGMVEPRKGTGETWGVSHINPVPSINAVVISWVRYASYTDATQTGYAHFLSFGKELKYDIDDGIVVINTTASSRYLKIGGVYPVFGTDTNVFMVTSRDGECGILICPTGDGNVCLAPTYISINRSTEKILNVYYNSENRDIIIRQGTYDKMRIKQIAGETKTIVCSVLNGLETGYTETTKKKFTISNL